MAKKQTFEDALLAANTVISELENGDLSLEQAMEKYKKGTELLSYCKITLADAEIEFTKLASDINRKMEENES
ncbi:hypothetical protein AwErysi_04010 [Erysipelotrichaceae bacterium]|nr:hypothetical protein AwErysi_04010 [Erysipelotrichaceae bacterium]